MPAFDRYLLWPVLFLCHLLAVSLLSWHLLAQANFLYPISYRWLAIDAHIQHYGPENHYKSSFAQTTPTEHQQLFNDIVRAIQNHGTGLADIRYRLPDTTQTPLMHGAEIIHLQDVANLIDIFYITGAAAALLWLLLLVYAAQRKIACPPIKKIMLGFSAGLTLLAIGFLIIGPEKVFYWLHELIFPDDHQWFFYYQESLMTTLMKAPDLFGLIGIFLIACCTILWLVSVWGMHKLLNRIHQ